MYDIGCVANGDDTARDIKPTKEKWHFCVFRMWPRTKPTFHACNSSILHITHRTHRNVNKIYKSIVLYNSTDYIRIWYEQL